MMIAVETGDDKGDYCYDYNHCHSHEHELKLGAFPYTFHLLSFAVHRVSRIDMAPD